MHKVTRLDIGCGNNKKEGFTGIDIDGDCGCDIIHDLFTFPWPIEDGVVEEVHCSHFFEHVPGQLRGKFMDELYRITKPGTKMTFITPYWNSARAVQDYTHEWPPVCEESYLYFNKAWREANKLTHGKYALKCDFDYGYGYNLDAEVAQRNMEYQQFAIKHYSRSVYDLHVTLTRRD